MSVPRPRSRDVDRPVVTVCRGCCCGTAGKHPYINHEAQLAELRAAVGDAGLVRVSDCLDSCEHSNVVVVGPSAAGRRAGARPTWLLGVLDRKTTADIVTWVRGGGPGIAEPPAVLDLRVFTPARRASRLLGPGT